MVKRSREQSITVIWASGKYAIIRWNNRDYFLQGYTELLGEIFANSEYGCEVIHNKYHQAMLDILNIRTGESVLRQEINPASRLRADKWEVDDDDY